MSEFSKKTLLERATVFWLAQLPFITLFLGVTIVWVSLQSDNPTDLIFFNILTSDSMAGWLQKILPHLNEVREKYYGKGWVERWQALLYAYSAVHVLYLVSFSILILITLVWRYSFLYELSKKNYAYRGLKNPHFTPEIANKICAVSVLFAVAAAFVLHAYMVGRSFGPSAYQNDARFISLVNRNAFQTVWMLGGAQILIICAGVIFFISRVAMRSDFYKASVMPASFKDAASTPRNQENR